MSDQIKVQVRHLTKKFGDLLVLSDVSFDVMDGDLLCVVGPTGCGKTTFLNSLVNIYDTTSGEILLDGQKVDTKKQNIAYILSLIHIYWRNFCHHTERRCSRCC